MGEQTTKKKQTGSTFTPIQLADFLSKKIISYCGSLTGKVVLDPACGEGMLLLSISKLSNYSIGEVIGYDTNEEYICRATRNLEDAGVLNPKIKNSDFLEISRNKADLFSEINVYAYADIVIANPPYVRTQIMGGAKSKQIANDFNLSGKVDLYFPFLIGITNSLKHGGIVGVITSNRYLTTKSGSCIREFLLENYDILEVIDLGDSQLFDASVLPAILIGRKKSTKSKLQSVCKFARLYEVPAAKEENVQLVNSVYDILSKEVSGTYKMGKKLFEYKTGLMAHSTDKTDVWRMTDDEENSFICTIQKHTYCLVRDKFKVRVGIKSCADDVFLNSQWDQEILAEHELFKPMISRESIQRWNCKTANLPNVLYPHYEKEGVRCVYDIDKYPKTKEYLLAHKQQLESRSYLIQAGRKWYEMWVPQNPGLWKFPKIVFPDISLEAQFAYDESGAVVNGNCYWIVARTEYEKNLLFLIQGVANSDMMKVYHDLCFNNKLYSGRRRYLSQYVEQYPLPNPNNVYAKRIVEIVKELNAKGDPSACKTLIQELNENVNDAFGIMG